MTESSRTFLSREPKETDFESFTFWRSYATTYFCIQDPEQRLAYIEAILQYGLNNESPDISNPSFGYFALCKPNIDISHNRVKAGRNSRKNKPLLAPCNSSDTTQEINIGTKNNTRPKQRTSILQATGKQVTGTSEANFQHTSSTYKSNSTQSANYIEKKKNETENKEERENLLPRTDTNFIPPTLDDIKAFCTEADLCIDPVHFLDYHNARGWTLSNGVRMVDWKSALRNWQWRENQKLTTQRTDQPIGVILHQTQAKDFQF